MTWIKHNAFVIRVHYPMAQAQMQTSNARIVVRSEADWEVNREPDTISEDGNTFTFVMPQGVTHLYFKPILIDGDQQRWSLGENYLAIPGLDQTCEVYPHFVDAGGCSVCDLLELIPELGNSSRFRVFRPPGYVENTLKRYPVLYMQDGQNLFFPDEAFGGKHWRVEETLSMLNAMSIINEVIVVGVYPDEREQDYTLPGYVDFGRYLVEQLKPSVDRTYRTLPDREHTAVMGSSLGGVVSFYLAWEYPDMFGNVACLSSTFGWRDDLLDRAANETARNTRIYLDSGWPGDNFEVTRNMTSMLERNGYRIGSNLLYLAFPEAPHNEQAWAMRSHIPYQFIFGASWRVSSR